MGIAKQFIEFVDKDEWKSGLIGFYKGEEVHYTLYQHKHPETEIEPLRKELATDEEFDLMGVADDLDIRVMTPQEFRKYKLHFQSISSTNH